MKPIATEQINSLSPKAQFIHEMLLSAQRRGVTLSRDTLIILMSNQNETRKRLTLDRVARRCLGELKDIGIIIGHSKNGGYFIASTDTQERSALKESWLRIKTELRRVKSMGRSFDYDERQEILKMLEG